MSRQPTASRGKDAEAVELERAVLSVVLDGRHEDAWQTVLANGVNIAAFYEERHRLVALMVDRLATAGEQIDAMTVAEAAARCSWSDAKAALRARNDGVPAASDAIAAAASPRDSVLAGIGGRSALGAIADARGSVTGLATNARLLVQRHRQRVAASVVDHLARDLARPDGVERLGDLIAEATEGLQRALAPTTSGGQSAVRTAEDRSRDRRSPPPMIVDGLLPEGGIGAIVALPGVGKTLCALELARCVAAGEDFGRHRTQRGAVLYVATDAPASTERRLLTLNEDLARRVLTITAMPPLPAGMAQLKRSIAEAQRLAGEPIRLVIIDTWDSTRDHSSGGYADQDAGAELIMRGLRALAADLSLAVVVIHHATRGDETRARGSLVFDARCDWIATAKSIAGGPITLESYKARDGECGLVGSWMVVPADVAGRSVPMLMRTGDGAEASQAANRDRAVLSAARTFAQSGKPIIARALAQELRVGNATIARAAESLRDAGLMDHNSYAPTPDGLAWLDDDYPAQPSVPPPTKTPSAFRRGVEHVPRGTPRRNTLENTDASEHSARNTAAEHAPPFRRSVSIEDGTSGTRRYGATRAGRLQAQPNDAEDTFADDSRPTGTDAG